MFHYHVFATFWLLVGCKMLQTVAKLRNLARMLQTVLNLSQSVAGVAF